MVGPEKARKNFRYFRSRFRLSLDRAQQITVFGQTFRCDHNLSGSTGLIRKGYIENWQKALEFAGSEIMGSNLIT